MCGRYLYSFVSKLQYSFYSSVVSYLVVEERHEDHVKVFVQVPNLVHVLVLHAFPRQELAQQLLRSRGKGGLFAFEPGCELVGVFVGEKDLRTFKKNTHS